MGNIGHCTGTIRALYGCYKGTTSTLYGKDTIWKRHYMENTRILPGHDSRIVLAPGALHENHMDITWGP